MMYEFGDHHEPPSKSEWIFSITLGLIAVIAIVTICTIDEAQARTPATLTKGCGKHVHVLDRRACIVRRVFGRDGRKAVRVAMCESRLDPKAVNGQYKGVFQMGSSERAKYGHGRTVLEQSKAAKAYFDDAGWAPWTCA